MYARALIAGWFCTWKKENYNIDLLSFSDPKCWYENEPEPFKSGNICLHDYYSIDTNKIARNDLKNLENLLKNIKSKFQNAVIIDCLSSLVLYVGLAKALWFIEKLSKQVSQLICIYRRDFIQNKIPGIETLGTTYVKLEKFNGISSINNLTYTAKLIRRKLSGSVMCQTLLIRQNNKSYQINAEKIMVHKPNQISINQHAKIESSFRIEINAREMEQRNKTPLPYTLNTVNTSKIFYQPDDVDDIDEDDPDNDLMNL
jgi:hypothetical protein